MSEEFWLRDLYGLNRSEVGISRNEYEKIIEAWKFLVATLVIEEEWDSLVQNYIDLELDILRSAMRSMIISHDEYHHLQDTRLSFSRRLSNLLSSCRAYLDHTPHHLNEIGQNASREAFGDVRRAAHSKRFGYRFMEALRNHSQHRGAPLHSASFQGAWVEGGGVDPIDMLRYSAAAAVDVRELREDAKFPRKILQELGNQEWIDVATHLRDYVEGLGDIHDSLRGDLKDRLAECEATARDAFSRIDSTSDRTGLGVEIVAVNNGTVSSSTSVFEKLLERVERLIRRNRSLRNLKRRFVTNEPTAQKRGVRRSRQR